MEFPRPAISFGRLNVMEHTRGENHVEGLVRRGKGCSFDLLVFEVPGFNPRVAGLRQTLLGEIHSDHRGARECLGDGSRRIADAAAEVKDAAGASRPESVPHEIGLQIRKELYRLSRRADRPLDRRVVIVSVCVKRSVRHRQMFACSQTH